MVKTSINLGIVILTMLHILNGSYPEVFENGDVKSSAAAFRMTDTGEVPEIEGLFFSLDPKSTPLYLCSGASDGIKYRLPKKVTCPILPTAEKSEVLKVTYFWEDVSKQPIQGYECNGEKIRYERHYSWYFTSSEEKHPKDKVYISETNCRDMIKTHKTPDGRDMKRIREGVFGTSDYMFPDYKYAQTTVHENINYFFFSATMTVSNKDRTIQTNLLIIDNCLATSGQCPTVQGVLVWSPKSVKTCRIQEGRTTLCLKTGSRVSCPETNLALTNITLGEICGVTLGLGAQGAYVSSEKPSEILDGVASTSKARVKLGLEALNARRRRRSLGDLRTRMVADMELNARFQYLYDLVRDNQMYNIQMFHSQICNLNLITMNVIRYLAESGNPTIIARALLDNNAYRARLNGDVLSLWKCEEIHNYFFLNRNNCTLEWPIRFISGHDQQEGWVTPLSHEIVRFPTIVQCPPPNFYFDTGNEVVLLTNRSVVSYLPRIPNPAETKDGQILPAINFNKPGEYSIEDITGQETMIGLVRNLGNRYMLDDAVRHHQQGQTLSVGESKSLSSLQDIALAPIRDTLNRIMFAIFLICTTFIIVAVTVYYKQVYAFLKLVYDSLSAAYEAGKAALDNVYDSLTKEKKIQNSDETGKTIIDGTSVEGGHGPFYDEVDNARGYIYPLQALNQAIENSEGVPPLPIRRTCKC